MGTILDDFYKDGTLISSNAYKDNLARINYSKERLDKYFNSIQSFKYHESFVTTDDTTTVIKLTKGKYNTGGITVTLNGSPYTDYEETSDSEITLNSTANKGDEFDLYYSNIDGISPSEIDKLVTDYQAFLIEAKNLRELLESIKEIWNGYYQDAADKAISDLENYYKDQDSKRDTDFNQYKADRLAELDKIFSVVPDMQTTINNLDQNVKEARETLKQLDITALTEKINEINQRMQDLLAADEKATAATNEATKAVKDVNDFVNDVFTHQEKYKGLQGDTTYVHWAWSWNSVGTDRFTTTYPNDNFISEGDFHNKSTDTKSTAWAFGSGLTKKEFVTVDGLNYAHLVGTGDGVTQSISIDKSDNYLLSLVVPKANVSKKIILKVTLKVGADTTKNVVTTLTVTPTSDGLVSMPIDAKGISYDGATVTVSGEGTYDIEITNVKLEIGSTVTLFTYSTAEDADESHPYYMGYCNNLSADPVTDPAKYSWFRVKGDPGTIPDVSNYVTKTNFNEVATAQLNVNGNKPAADGTIKVKTIVSVKSQYLESNNLDISKIK